MTFLATKINCDGDKCGACRFRHYDFHSDTYECIMFHEEVVDNRLPECLAAELVEDCELCRHDNRFTYMCDAPKMRDNPDACRTECTDNGYPWWQPATKGER